MEKVSWKLQIGTWVLSYETGFLVHLRWPLRQCIVSDLRAQWRNYHTEWFLFDKSTTASTSNLLPFRTKNFHLISTSAFNVVPSTEAKDGWFSAALEPDTPSLHYKLVVSKLTNMQSTNFMFPGKSAVKDSPFVQKYTGIIFLDFHPPKKASVKLILHLDDGYKDLILRIPQLSLCSGNGRSQVTLKGVL